MLLREMVWEKFSERQPRIPAGSPQGGQFASGSGEPPMPFHKMGLHEAVSSHPDAETMDRVVAYSKKVRLDSDTDVKLNIKLGPKHLIEESNPVRRRMFETMLKIDQEEWRDRLAQKRGMKVWMDWSNARPVVKSLRDMIWEKHLPGRHNQADHGRRGVPGGGDQFSEDRMVMAALQSGKFRRSSLRDAYWLTPSGVPLEATGEYEHWEIVPAMGVRLPPGVDGEVVTQGLIHEGWMRLSEGAEGFEVWDLTPTFKQSITQYLLQERDPTKMFFLDVLGKNASYAFDRARFANSGYDLDRLLESLKGHYLPVDYLDFSSRKVKVHGGEKKSLRDMVYKYDPAQPRDEAGRWSDTRWECLRAKVLAGVEWQKHLPGKHDQSTHGRRGESLPRSMGGVAASEIPKVEFRDDVDADEFIAARNRSEKSPFISQSSTEDLRGTRLFLSDDGRVGYGVTRDGDLVNVFNNGGPKGAGSAAVLRAVSENGAKTLDCFDGKLPQIYSRAGFVPTGRLAFNEEYAPQGWDYEKFDHPDVVFMSYRGGDRGKIRQKYGKFRRYNTAAGRKFIDYDQAKLASLAAAQN